MSRRQEALEILQNKTAFAFEGGGVLGISLAGALVRLYELGGLDTIDHVTGTSVGSIVATALAMGATSYYIEQKLLTLDLTKFMDGGSWISNIIRLFTKYGLYKGDYIETFVSEILDDLVQNSDITFIEAYQLTGIHLTIPYLSMKEKRTKYADHVITPDLKIRTAVRWSSTIPYFFKANKKYTNGMLTDTLVDGGILDNYPLHVLKEQNCNINKIMGFKMCNTMEKNQYKPIPDEDVSDLPTDIFVFSKNFLEILYNKLLGSHIAKDEWKRTCKIDIGSYSSTDFNVTEEDKTWLYNSGKDAVDKYLAEIETMLENNEYFL